MTAISEEATLRAMAVRTRIRLAQNFITHEKLAEELVRSAGLSRSDVVYEIGPGEGVLTRALVRHAGKVIAIELDANLAQYLATIFKDEPRVQIHHGDFLRYKLCVEHYKVFANVPFNITADTVKRLLNAASPPSDAYLILQKEAAGKYAGVPRETEVSVLWKPWFSFSVVWEFRRTDFDPAPSVDVAMLHIARRRTPLVSAETADLYRRFIRFAFRAWKSNLKTAFKLVFTYEQWKRLSRAHGFDLKATPTELTFEQWLGIFQYFLIGTTDKKKQLIA